MVRGVDEVVGTLESRKGSLCGGGGSLITAFGARSRVYVIAAAAVAGAVGAKMPEAYLPHCHVSLYRC